MRIKEIKLVLGGLTLAILGTLLVVRAHSQPVAIVGVVVAGLGCSSVFPIYVAWLSKWYGSQARRLGGVRFTLAGFGGSSIPWAVGFVSKYAGGLRVGLLVPVTACLIMIILVVGMRQRIHA
jgi:fucose permease